MLALQPIQVNEVEIVTLFGEFGKVEIEPQDAFTQAAFLGEGTTAIGTIIARDHRIGDEGVGERQDGLKGFGRRIGQGFGATPEEHHIGLEFGQFGLHRQGGGEGVGANLAVIRQ